MSLRCLLVAVFATVLLAPGGAGAETFRCTTFDGATLYSDTPCPPGSVSSKNVTERIGQCTTDECTAERRRTEQEALQRLQSQKDEIARYRELRLREEETRLRAATAERNENILAALEARIEQLAQAQATPVYFYPHVSARHRHSARHRCKGHFPADCTGVSPEVRKPHRHEAEPVRMPLSGGSPILPRAKHSKFVSAR